MKKWFGDNIYSKSHIKVVLFLTKNKPEKFTTDQVSENCSIKRDSARRLLSELTNEKIIKRKPVTGKIAIYSCNKGSFLKYIEKNLICADYPKMESRKKAEEMFVKYCTIRNIVN